MSSTGRFTEGKVAHLTGTARILKGGKDAHLSVENAQGQDALGTLLSSVDASDSDAVTAAGGQHLASIQEGFRVDRVVEAVTPEPYASTGDPRVVSFTVGDHGHDGHGQGTDNSHSQPTDHCSDGDEPQAVIQIVPEATVLIPSPLSLLGEGWPVAVHGDDMVAEPPPATPHTAEADHLHDNEHDHALLPPAASPLALQDMLCGDEHHRLDTHLQQLSPAPTPAQAHAALDTHSLVNHVVTQLLQTHHHGGH